MKKTLIAGLTTLLLAVTLVVPGLGQDIRRGLSKFLLISGTSAAPSLGFTSEPGLGFYRAAAGALAIANDQYDPANPPIAFLSSGNMHLGPVGGVGWTAGSATAAYDLILTRPFPGHLSIANAGGAIGNRIKVDALPTASTCGTSPAVIAGSTAFSGSINVGTGTPASCIVLFNGATAFPSNPFCTANVVTATAADVRALGALSTTTQVTFTPATAFVASSVVAWTCISAK